MLWPLPGLPLLYTSLFIWCECIMFGLAIWVLFFFTPAIDDDCWSSTWINNNTTTTTTSLECFFRRVMVMFFFLGRIFFTRKKTWLEMKIWFFSGDTRILLIHSTPNFLFSFFSIANSCVCVCVCLCCRLYSIQNKQIKNWLMFIIQTSELIIWGYRIFFLLFYCLFSYVFFTVFDLVIFLEQSDFQMLVFFSNRLFTVGCAQIFFWFRIRMPKFIYSAQPHTPCVFFCVVYIYV